MFLNYSEIESIFVKKADDRPITSKSECMQALKNISLVEDSVNRGIAWLKAEKFPPIMSDNPKCQRMVDYLLELGEFNLEIVTALRLGIHKCMEDLTVPQ